MSRAHLGTLFLDEFPLFNADIVQALRQPLESGDVTIARGEESATFPARAMVVVACNPCPCGYYHPTNRDNRCSCAETRRRHYRTKLEGPVIDRIDIVRHVRAGARRTRPTTRSPGPSRTATVRARVTTARERQAERYDGTGWRLNADVPGPTLLQRHPLTRRRCPAARHAGWPPAPSPVEGATRVHRVAWTVADLRGLDRPGADEVDVALRLRTGDPLLLSSLTPAGRP